MAIYKLNNIGENLLLRFENPITNLISFKDVYDNLQGIGQVVKKIRWSFDNENWSSWVLLNKDNISSISISPEDSIYFEFDYTLTTPGSVTFSEITLEFNQVSEDNNKDFNPITSNYNLCCEQSKPTKCDTNLITNNSCDTTFNPYLMNEHLCVYNKIVNGINDMFGIDVTYIKLDPQQRSTSFTFREHTIFGGRNPECLKILIPNNELPDSKPQFNPWGVNFEVPIELHITKESFKKIFGNDAVPQKGDIVYIPIYDRILEITSSYSHKGFMLSETYWIVALKKYRPKSNTYMQETTEDLIDDITNSAENAFGKKINEENKKINKPQQYHQSMGTSVYDPSRKAIDKNLKITSTNIDNNGTIISEHHYDLSSLFSLIERKEAVIYKNSVKFSENDELSFMTWFKSTNSPITIYEDNVNIVSFNNSTNILTVNIKAIRNYKPGTIIGIKRDFRNMFFGIVQEQISDSVYTLKIENEVIEYLNTLDNWNTKKGYKAFIEFPKIFIHGHNGEYGWKIESILDKFFIITLNNLKYFFITDKQLNDRWYGMFLTISNKFNQLSLNFWQINENNNSSKLYKIFNETKQITKENRSIDLNYAIFASNHLQTNLRIFNKIPKEELQSDILNQNIVDDSHLALLIDNALPKISIPFIGNAK